MSFLEFVNAKYEELLEMMKSSKEERKASMDRQLLSSNVLGVMSKIISTVQGSSSRT